MFAVLGPEYSLKLKSRSEFGDSMKFVLDSRALKV